MASSSSAPRIIEHDRSPLDITKSFSDKLVYLTEKKSIDVLREYINGIKNKLHDKLTELGYTELLNIVKSWSDTDFQSLTKDVLIQQFKNINKDITDEDRTSYQKLYTYFTSDNSAIDDINIDNLYRYRKYYACCLIYSIVNDPNNDSTMDTIVDHLVSIFSMVGVFTFSTLDINSDIRFAPITLKIPGNIFPSNISSDFIKRINIDDPKLLTTISGIAVPSYKYFEQMKNKIFNHIKETYGSEDIISLLSSFNTAENITYHFSMYTQVYEALELIKQKLYPEASCYNGNILSINMNKDGGITFSINLQEEVLSCTKKYKFIVLLIYFPGYSIPHAVTCIVEKTPKRKIYINDFSHIGHYEEQYRVVSMLLRSLLPDFEIILITPKTSVSYTPDPSIDPEGYCATINLLVNYALCYAYTYSDTGIKDDENFTLYVLLLFKLKLRNLVNNELLNLIRNFIILIHQYANKCFASRLKHNKRVSIPPYCIFKSCTKEFEQYKNSTVSYTLEDKVLSIVINDKKYIINDSTDDTIKKFAMMIYMCYTTSIEHLQCMFGLIADNIINMKKKSKLREHNETSIRDSAIRPTYNHEDHSDDEDLY